MPKRSQVKTALNRNYGKGFKKNPEKFWGGVSRFDKNWGFFKSYWKFLEQFNPFVKKCFLFLVNIFSFVLVCSISFSTRNLYDFEPLNCCIYGMSNTEAATKQFFKNFDKINNSDDRRLKLIALERTIFLCLFLWSWSVWQLLYQKNN